MTFLETVEKQIEIGMPIFHKLFNHKSQEIRELVGKAVQGKKLPKNVDGMFEKATVEKTSRNDEPWNISINFYDHIEINWMGIKLVSEYGQRETIVEFGESFNPNFFD